MCNKPSKIVTSNGDQILIGCRECWQCQLTRSNDLVGKALAEQQTADATFFVTLTYGRGDAGEIMHESATVLTYRHVQMFLKRLRNKGYNVRYMCAGEYGSLRGRAHWHLVLFFRGKVPDWPEDRRFHSEFWEDNGVPRGFVHSVKASYSNLRYAVKYLYKDQVGGIARASYSRFPPLGSEYILHVARCWARAGVVPQSTSFKLRVSTIKGLRDVRFRITGVMRDAFMREWLETYLASGFDLDPSGCDSELVNAFIRYGRCVNYDMAYEYDMDKRQKDAKLEKRFEYIEARSAFVKSLQGRYVPYNIPSDLGEYFWRSIEDGQVEGRRPRQLWRTLIAECRASEPGFNPFSNKWRKSWKRRGVYNPIAGGIVDCDREPARERARKRKLVARIRKLFAV